MPIALRNEKEPGAHTITRNTAKRSAAFMDEMGQKEKRPTPSSIGREKEKVDQYRWFSFTNVPFPSQLTPCLGFATNIDGFPSKYFVQDKIFCSGGNVKNKLSRTKYRRPKLVHRGTYSSTQPRLSCS